MPKRSPSGGGESSDSLASKGFEMPHKKCRTLLETVGKEIYSRNPFRLLALAVDVKNRQIRRQEKDLIAALESGDLAGEYPAGLRPDPLPDREEIAFAARELADPQKRFVYEFFWFWPLEWGKGKSDEALASHLRAGDLKSAQKFWNQGASGDDAQRACCRHNLAVLGHLLAIENEKKALSGSESRELPPEKIKKLNHFWNYAFFHWHAIQEDDEFWRMLEARVDSLAEARLTREFVASFRKDLPVAFDNINAELAVAFCNASIYGRAKDQVRIMKATNEGDDDVDASIRRVTEPLQKRIDKAIEVATEQLIQNKTSGKQRCRELFNTVRDTLSVLRTLLDETSSQFIETSDRVALGMLQCQVAYGNETQDWEGSLPLLKSAMKVARGQQARQKIQENIDTLAKNVELQRCWFCKKAKGLENLALKVKLRRDLTWAQVRKEPQKYLDLLRSAVEEVAKAVANNSNPALLVAAGNILPDLLLAKTGDVHAMVRVIDVVFPKDKVLVSQSVEVAVPRCHLCEKGHNEKTEQAKDENAVVGMGCFFWILGVLFSIAIWDGLYAWLGSIAFAVIVPIIMAVVFSSKLSESKKKPVRDKEHFNMYGQVKELLADGWVVAEQ